MKFSLRADSKQPSRYLMHTHRIAYSWYYQASKSELYVHDKHIKQGLISHMMKGPSITSSNTIIGLHDVNIQPRRIRAFLAQTSTTTNLWLPPCQLCITVILCPRVYKLTLAITSAPDPPLFCLWHMLASSIHLIN